MKTIRKNNCTGLLLSIVIMAGCNPDYQTDSPYESPYKEIVRKLGISADWQTAIQIAEQELKQPGLRAGEKLYYLFTMGDNYRFLEKYDLSEKYFREVLDHSSSFEYPEYRGEAFYGLGDLYYIKWAYFKEEDALSEAKIYLDSSAKISRQHNLQALESKNLYRSGTILQIQGENDASIENFKKGLEIAFAIADTVGMIRNDVHKASELERLGLLDSALFHNLRSYAYAKNQNRNYSEAHSLCNLGQFYFEYDNLDSARWYFDRAELLSEELNHGIVLCRSYYNLARYHARFGRSNLSGEYLEKGRTIAGEKGYQNFVSAFDNLRNNLSNEN